jgi:Transcription elongation factor, GreA/GreB, C-term
MSNKPPLPTGLQLTAVNAVFRERPHDYLDRLRTEDPVHCDEELGRLFLTRVEDVRAVVSNRSLSVDRDQIFFRATVTCVNGRGSEMTITIVGIDEADLDSGQVSWLSPVAKALMRARQGDIVDLRAPAGIEQIEVLSIRYGSTDRNAC